MIKEVLTKKIIPIARGDYNSNVHADNHVIRNVVNGVERMMILGNDGGYYRSGFGVNPVESDSSFTYIGNILNTIQLYSAVKNRRSSLPWWNTGQRNIDN